MSIKFKYSWEQAVEVLRNNSEHKQGIYFAYLTKDLFDNCYRFYNSDEFKEVLEIIKKEMTECKKILDLAAGNGIASYSFAKTGYETFALEPDPSQSVGRGAIEYIKQKENLKNLSIFEGYGEKLPFSNATFDVVYIRQGMHHASDINKMLSEVYRVLAPGGILIATREHVVDDYSKGLKKFLDAQVDHQLYGGENAYKHSDYVSFIFSNKLHLLYDLGPYDSIINLFPYTFNDMKEKILSTKPGWLLSKFLSKDLVYKIGIWYLKKKKIQGRLFSFIAKKL